MIKYYHCPILTCFLGKTQKLGSMFIPPNFFSRNRKSKSLGNTEWFNLWSLWTHIFLFSLGLFRQISQEKRTASKCPSLESQKTVFQIEMTTFFFFSSFQSAPSPQRYEGSWGQVSTTVQVQDTPRFSSSPEGLAKRRFQGMVAQFWDKEMERILPNSCNTKP